jgi:hypothetical protein
MFVRVRPARMSDLPYCRDSIRDRAIYSDTDADQLVELWRELLAAGSSNAIVMENLSSVPEQRLLWFCMAVFPTIKFARELAESNEPYVAKKIFHALSCGNAHSHLLNADEIRRANSAEGLTYLVLNSGAPAYAQTEPTWSEVLNRLGEFNVYHAQGYRLRDLMIESYNATSARWLTNIGLKLRNGYTAYNGSERSGAPVSATAPMLYGCSYDEAAALQGSLIASMMHYREPVVYFTLREQHLLLHALAGDTDDELAALLNCSNATIRKRWLAIYDKIAEHPRTLDLLPAFLGSKSYGRDRPGAAHETFRRGTEKKRILLQYLRQHMEELRPAREPVAPWRPRSNSPIAL